MLDTNAFTHFLAGDELVLEYMLNSEIIYLPVVVLAELLTGFKGGSKVRENRQMLQKFLGKPGVQLLQVGEETAEICADIKTHLKKSRTSIPLNDIWIAATAIETGSVLVTYDRHFFAGGRLAFMGGNGIDFLCFSCFEFFLTCRREQHVVQYQTVTGRVLM